MNHKIYIIAAADENMGIGKNGRLPWHLENELRHFKEITTVAADPDKLNMVIMGRTTWESIPKKRRPLGCRKNVVLTNNPAYTADGAEIFNSLSAAIASADESTGDIFIIGGASVYREAIARPDISGIYLTRVRGEYDCDAFFPEIPEKFGEPVSLGISEDDKTSLEYLFYGK